MSKYSCKGKFDCPYISEGYCLKPRRCSSCRFGFGSDSMYDELKRWLLAEDVFGKYDYKNIEPSEDMVKILASRRYICINEIPYPLPKLFVDEFFKVRSFLKRYYYVSENNQVKKYPYYVKSDKSTPYKVKLRLLYSVALCRTLVENASICSKSLKIFVLPVLKLSISRKIISKIESALLTIPSDSVS